MNEVMNLPPIGYWYFLTLLVLGLLCMALIAKSIRKSCDENTNLKRIERDLRCAVKGWPK